MSRKKQGGNLPGVYFLVTPFDSKELPKIESGNVVAVNEENDTFTIVDQDGCDHTFPMERWGYIVFEKLEQAMKAQQKLPLVGTKVWCVDPKKLKVTLETVSSYIVPFVCFKNGSKAEIRELDNTVFIDKVRALSKLDYLKKK